MKGPSTFTQSQSQLQFPSHCDATYHRPLNLTTFWFADVSESSDSARRRRSGCCRRLVRTVDEGSFLGKIVILRTCGEGQPDARRSECVGRSQFYTRGVVGVRFDDGRQVVVCNSTTSKWQCLAISMTYTCGGNVLHLDCQCLP